MEKTKQTFWSTQYFEELKKAFILEVTLDMSLTKINDTIQKKIKKTIPFKILSKIINT